MTDGIPDLLRRLHEAGTPLALIAETAAAFELAAPDPRIGRACRQLHEAGLPVETFITAAEIMEPVLYPRTRGNVVALPKKERRLDCSAAEWADLRAAVFQRDNYTCVYCTSRLAPLHCDHVMPLSRGGRSVMENLATACAPCNISKGDRTPEEWKRRA